MSLNKKKIASSPKVRELYRRRRQALLIKVSLFVFLFAIFLFGLSYLSRYPKFVIQEIEIRGAKAISKEHLETLAEEKISGNYAFIFSKKNILIYPKGSLEKALLDKFKRIQKLSVERLGQKLIIDVEERQGEYLLCGSEDSCYFMDSVGFVFDKAPNFSGSVYFKIYTDAFFTQGEEIIGRKFLEEEKLLGIFVFRDRISQIIQIDSLEAPESGEYKFNLAIGGNTLKPYIFFRKEGDFNKLFENLTLALETEPLLSEFQNKANLEYLDLRYNNKVLYKFK